MAGGLELAANTRPAEATDKVIPQWLLDRPNIGATEPDRSDKAPDSATARVAIATTEGVLLALPMAAKSGYDQVTQHTVATGVDAGLSLGTGAILRTALPEGGVWTKVFGGVLLAGYLGYYAYENGGRYKAAIKQAANADTMSQVHDAGSQMGNALGEFTFDTASAALFVTGGAGIAKYALLSERADGFAIAKDLFWHPKEQWITNKLGSWGDRMTGPDAAMRAHSLELMPRYEVKGPKAELLDSNKAVPLGETVEAPNPDQQISIDIYARSKDTTGRLMDRRHMRIQAKRQGFADDAEIADKYGPKQESIKAIKQWGLDHNVKIDLAHPEQSLITGEMRATGRLADIEAMLGTKFQTTKAPDGFTHRSRTGTYKVEPTVAEHIESVLGGDKRKAMRVHSTGFTPMDDLADPIQSLTAPRPRSGLSGRPTGIAGPVYLPDGNGGVIMLGGATAPEATAVLKPRPIYGQELARARGVTADMTGKGKHIVIGELAGDLDLDDNKIHYDERKLIQPKINKEAVGDHKITPDKGANGEVALDSIAVGETAPEAEQTLLFGENDDNGIARIQNEAAFPTNPARRPADAVSWSWGQYIEGWTQQSLRTTSNAMKRSALKGITTFAAAGDDGAPDKSPSGKATVDYPAADPFVVGVGGTQIIMSPSGQVQKETSWNDGPNSSTGGGMDRFFSERPDFQKGLKTPPDITGSTFNGRWVPDISEVGSPRSGLIVRVDGKKGVIGGTSWAAPQAAAEFTTISEKLGRNFGHINPFLYKNPQAFNDITEGDNNGYKSTKGWDPVTGLGTPKVQELMTALAKDGQGSRFTTRVVGSTIPRSQQLELGVLPVGLSAVPTDAK